MKKEVGGILILVVSLIVLIFHSYFFSRLVPFPANLLVSFYEPFVHYSWAGYPSGPPSKPILFDALRLYYPIRHVVDEEIRRGQFPLWNPYYFSGNPLLGSYQSTLFHPLSFLFFLLPQIDAWSIIVILQPLFAALGMYLFLRGVKLGKVSSTLGAIGFAFSGIMIAWWEEGMIITYSFLVMPFIFWAIHRLFYTKSKWSFVFLVLGMVWSIFSGSFQMTFYVFCAAGAWALTLWWQTKDTKMLGIIFLACIESLLITSVQLVPSFEAYLHSLRHSVLEKSVFDSFLADGRQWITYIAPDYWGNAASQNYFEKGQYHEQVLFVGMPLLFLGIYEVLHIGKSPLASRFAAGLLGITLLLGFSSPMSWFVLYTLKLPLIAEMTPSRIFFVSMFALVWLGAMGFERLLITRKIDGSMLVTIALFILVFKVGWQEAIWYHSAHPFDNLYAFVSLRNMVLPTIFAVLMIGSVVCVIIPKRFMQVIGIVGVIGISCVSSFLFAQKYLAFSERQFVFPSVPVLSTLQKIDGINRFWSLENASISTNIAMYYDLYSPEGYDSFNIDRYNQLVYASHRDGLTSVGATRADATLFEASSLDAIAQSSARQKALALLGVKYIVGRYSMEAISTESATQFTQVWHDDQFVIYQYQQALPRAFLTDRYQVITSPIKELQAVYNPANDLGKTLFLEQSVPFAPSGSPLVGKTEVTHYTPDAITLSVQTNKPSFLFLSDPYYPGWKAFVDGKQTPIYRADYAFRAIIVPEGKHVVQFVYQPLSVIFGVGLSLVGVISLIVYLFLSRRKLKGQ